LPSTTLTTRAKTFVDSILRLEPRMATFDCDGTLWSGDAGEGFFRWEIDEGLVSKDIADWALARYAEYKAGKVSEEVMCGEMVSMHKGLIETDIQRAATRYFDLFMYEGIFPEMRDLVHRLQAQGCEVWAVSSSNEWVIRAAMRHFAIPRARVIATAPALDKNRISEKLLRIPSGDGKPKAIHELAQKHPDAAFGNSRWDLEMLEASRHPVAVNPNPDLEKTARERNWTIYFPEAIAERRDQR
jgi:HAD superfamily phosphoserine phosphatase-like hydrolase